MFQPGLSSTLGPRWLSRVELSNYRVNIPVPEAWVYFLHSAWHSRSSNVTWTWTLCLFSPPSLLSLQLIAALWLEAKMGHPWVAEASEYRDSVVLAEFELGSGGLSWNKSSSKNYMWGPGTRARWSLPGAITEHLFTLCFLPVANEHPTLLPRQPEPNLRRALVPLKLLQSEDQRSMDLSLEA